MELDEKMKSENENFKVLSLKIQEDLGNVRYIFTDKTGTLTKNELEFKACSIINRLFYAERKSQSGNENLVEKNNLNENKENDLNKEYNPNNENNGNNINEENKENNEDINKEKLKKSMFADDFPLLSLKHALEMDYPISFNVDESDHDNQNILNKEKFPERFKMEKSISNKNNKINSDDTINNQDCHNYLIQCSEEEEMDNSYNLNFKINRDMDIRNDYIIPQVKKKKTYNKQKRNKNDNPLENEYNQYKNSESKNSFSSNSHIRDPKNSAIIAQNQSNFILNEQQIFKQNTKQATALSDSDNISNASIKLLQKQQQTSKQINLHKNTSESKTNIFNYDKHKCWDSSKELIKELFLNIALNHNVLLNKEESQLSYQGPNPDEVALATCAHELGIKFLEKDSNNNTLKLKVFDELPEYEVLFKIPFESSRKRSTIVVRENNYGKIKNKNENNLMNNDDKEEDPNQVVKIFIKGSDDVIFDLVDENSKKFVLPSTKQHLDLFAKGGLRTLCYAVKYINYEDFQSWKANYNMLINRPNNATLSQTESEIENLIKELEKNAILLGVTGLEDKLQIEVKETISDLIEARIHMWMLTGDNIDTAESIGFSSRIFNDDTEVFKLKAFESKEDLKANLVNTLKELENMEKEILRLKLERKRKIKKSKLKTDRINVNKDSNKKCFKDDQNWNNINENLNPAEGNKKKMFSNAESKNFLNGKFVFSKSKTSSCNNLNLSRMNNLKSEFNIIQNFDLEANSIRENMETEKNKNNSDDEFSKNKNHKYSNNFFNKNPIQQQTSTFKKLETLNICVNCFNFDLLNFTLSSFK